MYVMNVLKKDKAIPEIGQMKNKIDIMNKNVVFTVVGSCRPNHNKIIYYKRFEVLSNACKHINELENRDKNKNILYRVRLDLEDNVQLNLF